MSEASSPGTTMSNGPTVLDQPGPRHLWTSPLLSGCPWGIDLGRVRVPLPVRLAAALEAVRAGSSPREVVIQLVGRCAEPVRSPATVTQYWSGSADNVFRFGDDETATFFATLFSHIAHRRGLALAGHDLYHGHLFIADNEIGVLFHAKEFPRQFSMNSQCIYPVGDAQAGGFKDPRTGTATSIFDPDYHIRNFVYLASVNSCFALDPSSVSFPHDALPPHESADGHFHTISASAFGNYIGDLNYFHPLCSPTTNSAHLGVSADGMWFAVKNSIYGGERSNVCAANEVASQVVADVILSLVCTARARQVMSQAPSTRLSEDAFHEAVRLADGSVHRAAILIATVDIALRLEGFPKILRDEATRRLRIAHAAYDVLGPAVDASTAASILYSSAWDTTVLWDMCHRVHRAICSRAAVQASIRFDKLLKQANLLPTSKTVQKRPSDVGGMWVVLVGGETASLRFPDTRGQRPGSWFGGHSSLQSIGWAYQMLVPIIGRERIIVIAQLQETLDWLEEATKSPEDCRRMCGDDKFLPMLRSKLSETRKDCACLLADGGADYDGVHVNPATVIRVITGQALHSVQRVVPQGAHACGSLMLLMYSHGTAHPRRPPPAVDDDGDEEHYMQMPYPVPVHDENLYDDIPWRGDVRVFSTDEVDRREACRVLAAKHQTQLNHLEASGTLYGDMSYEGAVYDVDLAMMTATHRVCGEVRRLGKADSLWCWYIKIDPSSYAGVPDRFRERLYAVSLVRAYSRIIAESPGRHVIVLNHFCLSGGMSHFLRRDQYRNHLGTACWPFFVMVSSDDFETSLGYFWRCWIKQFVRSARTPTHLHTVRDVYSKAEERYWGKNESLLEHNQAIVCVSKKEPHTFGTVSFAEGGHAGDFGLVSDVSVWDLLYGSSLPPSSL